MSSIRIRNWINYIICKIKFYKMSVNMKPSSYVSRGSILEGHNVIGHNSIISGNLGLGSYVGENCLIRGKVGRYCSISNNVRIIVGIHPTNTFVSTHPCFYSIRKQAGFTYVNKNHFDEIVYADKNKNHVLIGNDVWIGEDAIIYGGIKIGDGAIIAAGSVVNKDVPPYSIVGGIPAKEIRKRFSEDEIKKLLKIQWWDLPTTWIEENINAFLDIKVFIALFEEK